VRIEVCGLIATIGGVTFMLLDTDAERMDGQTGNTFIYVVSVGCALSGALFFIFNAHLQE